MTPHKAFPVEARRGLQAVFAIKSPAAPLKQQAEEEGHTIFRRCWEDLDKSCTLVESMGKAAELSVVDAVGDALLGSLGMACRDVAAAGGGKGQALGPSLAAALVSQIDFMVELLQRSRTRLVTPANSANALGLPLAMGPSASAPTTAAVHLEEDWLKGRLGDKNSPTVDKPKAEPPKPRRRAWHEYVDDEDEEEWETGSNIEDDCSHKLGSHQRHDWGSTDSESEQPTIHPSLASFGEPTRPPSPAWTSDSGAEQQPPGPAKEPAADKGAEAPPDLERPGAVDDSENGTLRKHLQELRDESPERVLCLRKINRLGFNSQDVLEKHFRDSNVSAKVLVAHLFARPSGRRPARVRPAGVGFAVLRTREDVESVLALGDTQTIGGAQIQVQRYEPARAAATCEDE